MILLTSIILPYHLSQADSKESQNRCPKMYWKNKVHGKVKMARHNKEPKICNIAIVLYNITFSNIKKCNTTCLWYHELLGAEAALTFYSDAGKSEDSLKHLSWLKKRQGLGFKVYLYNHWHCYSLHLLPSVAHDCWEVK